MSEQPSNAELAWRLTQIQSDLRQVVGHPEYAADQRGLDRRLADIEEDVRHIRGRFDAHEKSHQEAGIHWRTLLWTGLLPAVAAILAVFLTAYLTRGR